MLIQEVTARSSAAGTWEALALLLHPSTGAQGRSRLGTHPAGVAEGSRLHPLLAPGPISPAEHHGAVPTQH